MLIYGRNAVLEALRDASVERITVAQGVRTSTIQDLLDAAEASDVPVDWAPRIELDQRLGTTSHQGVVAELPDLEYQPLEAAFALAEARGERPLLVLLDGVTDPRNYGAVIRSAEALGAHGVITEARRSAPLTAVVAKTSAGATSHLPLVQVTNLPRQIEQLKERNVWVYGADAGAPQGPSQVDWDRDAALVFGSEGSGLRRLVRERCDDLVAIPLQGQVASLNVAVAAGICIYAVLEGRARQAAKA